MTSKHMAMGVEGFDLENIFHSITDYVSIHDRDFRVVRVNAALCALLGKPENELVGKTCYQLFHGSDAPWYNCPQQAVMHKKTVVTELIEDPRLGVPLRVTCCPVYDEEGRLLGAVHMAKDVSEEQLKEREKELEIAQLRDTLAWLQGLSGIITICSSCKNIRNGDGKWARIEQYISEHTGARFSHGMCPSCFRKLFPGLGGFKAVD
jgi:PAS domain S-box-containing protein